MLSVGRMKRQTGVERGKMKNIQGRREVVAGKMENKRGKLQCRNGERKKHQSNEAEEY